MRSRYDTQDRLIEATRRIIINEGVEATNLEHICKVAGFSRGAFYSNFSSKDSLLAALAEDEYSSLIERLRATVDRWAARAENEDDNDTTSAASQPASPLPHGASDPLIENLLFEALEAIGVDKGLYVLHSELLMRSIRDRQWGERLLEINVQFVDELGRVLEYILNAAGRRLTMPLRALTHAVIGIVMRACGVAAWRASIRDVVDASALTSTEDEADRGSDEDGLADTAGESSSSSVADSAAREVLEVVLLVLYGASEPRPY